MNMTENIIDGRRPAELPLSELLFYPNIATNTLLFHGTDNQNKFQSILKQGLKPPDIGASQATLARRISYSSQGKYSGEVYGKIIAFKPNPDELESECNQFTRLLALHRRLRKLPPERAIFYLPGESSIPHEIYKSVGQITSDYMQNGFNQSNLINSLSNLVTRVESQLKKEAIFLNPETPDVHKYAQETTWNELDCNFTDKYDDVIYYSRELDQIRNSQNILSLDQLNQLLNYDELHHNFDSQEFLNNYRLIATAHEIKGLGFENYPFPQINHALEISGWLKSLPKNIVSPSANKPPLRRLLEKIKIFNQKN
jgi:hypothetical protein